MAEAPNQAKRFAQAVFEIAQEHSEFEKWLTDLEQIALLANSKEFVAVMENPKFPFEEKARLLAAQLKEANPKALNLAHILVNLGKFGLISDIYSEYQRLWEEHQGIEKAEVVAAVPLDDEEKEKLSAYLKQMTGKKTVMTVRVDPDIIGGFIARVGGKIIDGSTRNQLNALRGELANAGQ